MFWYYFKTSFKNLRSNKKFLVINIIGFAFAISICLAITLFLIKEYSYDRYHENVGRIVRLTDVNSNSSSIDYRVKNILTENYPEIKNGCIVQRIAHPINVQTNAKGFYLDDIMSVDNNFFEMFTVPFIAGNAKSPFSNINSAILTENTARTLFGNENPLGKEILIWSEIPTTVEGVIKDFPDNSSIGAGILVNAENEDFKFSWSCQNSDDLSSYRWPFRIYLQLNENVDENGFLSKINTNIDVLNPYLKEAGFLDLKDIYLKDKTDGSQSKRGNFALMKLLSGIAIIILILAIINYVNLTVAQQNKHIKDTGVRKTVGAFRINLLYHYLTESVIVSFVALIIAIFFLALSIPFYNTLFDSKINLILLFQFPNYLVVTGAIFFIGIVSGIGPAIVLSNISPLRILSGGIGPLKKKSRFRHSLTIFQFAISIILIFCISIIQRQIFYVKHKNPGFAKEQLLRLDLPSIKQSERQNGMALPELLHKSPNIKNLSISSGVPGEINMWMGTNIAGSDKNINVPCIIADTAFVKTFDLKIIKGRNLEPGDFGKVCMVNEAFYNHFEFDNLENKRFKNYSREGFEIIAVVKDFHYNSLHNQIGPACLIFSEMTPRSINIRLAGNQITSGMDFIRKTWNEILPGYPLKYQFYDDWYDSMYRKEERFAKSIGLFAILAIVISCIGILGLAIFSSERRIKEIGIRKVNGAKVSEILAMLNKDFVKWVVIAFIIACPVAYYTMHKWLENFAYKTSLSWWIFALAGLVALGIALLTVSFQSWKAATRNPVEALRYE